MGPWAPSPFFVHRITVGRRAAWKLSNNRPRKCLNYRTPYEVFREAHGALDV